MRKLVPLFVVVTFLALSPRVARAQDKAACLSAYERTQTLRKENKLREAREQLLVCTQAVCPKLVRVDCGRWMEEVTSSLPTVVFAVHDAQGRDRSDARVLIDGEAVTQQLGQEVVVDPGPHTVRFEAPGGTPVEQPLVVRAGEKSRAVTVTIADLVKPEPEPPPPSVVPEKRPPPPSDSARPLPVLVPVLGGAGVAALGVGAYLAITTASQLDDLRSTCAPHCEQSDVDTLNLRYRIAAVSIGAGVVAIGAAVWMFVSRPATRDRSVGNPNISPSVGMDLQRLTLRF